MICTASGTYNNLDPMTASSTTTYFRLQGLYRGSIIQKNCAFFRLLNFRFCFLGVSWFLIIPKWLIKASGHIPIFFGTFLELQKINQIWTCPPLIYHRNTLKIQEIPNHFSKTFLHINRFWISKALGFSKRHAPNNYEESCNKILKSLDMRPISIKKHESNFANMVPISATKH